jgi:hypothetical protein
MRHRERGCQAAKTANRMMTAISMSIAHQYFPGYPLCDQKEATLHVRQEIEKVVSGVVKKREIAIVDGKDKVVLIGVLKGCSAQGKDVVCSKRMCHRMSTEKLMAFSEKGLADGHNRNCI